MKNCASFAKPLGCEIWKAVKLRVSDCNADCVWLAVPQATERQRIGNEIDAAFVFARAPFLECGSALPLFSLRLDSECYCLRLKSILLMIFAFILFLFIVWPSLISRYSELISGRSLK